MALSPEDFQRAGELLDNLPGLKQAIAAADDLSDEQLEGLIRVVEGAAEAMREPEGSARQDELVSGLIQINDTISSKLEAAENQKEDE